MASLSRSMAWQRHIREAATTGGHGLVSNTGDVRFSVTRDVRDGPPDVVTGTDRVFGGRHRVHLVTLMQAARVPFANTAVAGGLQGHGPERSAT